MDHKDAERGSLESLQNAIVEMRILSEMGELVGTLGSSFTQIAAAWGQLVPHNVMPDGCENCRLAIVYPRFGCFSLTNDDTTFFLC